MTGEPIAKSMGDGLLQSLDLGVAELDDGAGFLIDQVVVVRATGQLVVATTVRKGVFDDHAGVPEKPEGAVYGRQRNPGKLAGRDHVYLLGVRVPPFLNNDPGDDPTLPGQFEAMRPALFDEAFH